MQYMRIKIFSFSVSAKYCKQNFVYSTDKRFLKQGSRLSVTDIYLTKS